MKSGVFARFASLALALLAPWPCGHAQTAAPGYQLQIVADVQFPTSLAFPPAGSAFGTDLFIGSITGPHDTGGSDFVFKLDSLGNLSVFSTLLAEADPVALEFPPPGSIYGDFLYVVSNNRDFGVPLDNGGTLQKLDITGNATDFALPTGLLCAFPSTTGLGEPNGLAFAPLNSLFGNNVYVANGSEYPGDVMKVNSLGMSFVFVDDFIYACAANVGLNILPLEFGPGGAFGTDLYAGDVTPMTGGIRKIDPLGNISPPFVTLRPFGLEFGPGGSFGTDLYAVTSSSVYRISPDGSFVSVASGFTIDNNPLGYAGSDLLEFSPDGTALYIADSGANRVYRLTRICDTDATASSYGLGKAGTNGVPGLTSSQPPVVGGLTDVRIDNGLPGAPLIMFLGLAMASAPFDGGTLLVNPLVVLRLGSLDSIGTAVVPVTIPPDAALCGLDVYFQAMFPDPAASGFYHTAQSPGLHWKIGS